MTLQLPDPQLFAQDIVFGEGLRWHDSRLWMSDMLGRKVLAFDINGRRELVAEVPGKPNGLGFLPDGRLVIASMEDRRLLRREASGQVVEHADLSSHMTGYSGDMAIDSYGRAYVDDVGYRVFEGASPSPGRLLLVQPDGEVSVQDEPLMFPNGMWITPDRQRLVVAEGRPARLYSYGFGLAGALRDKQLIVDLQGKTLDGLTLDCEGGIWQCQPYERRVIRLVGSEITHQISFPHLKPVSVCLGGDDLRTLFIVAADYTLERMATNDCWAALHSLRIEVPGFPLLAG